MTTQLPHEPPKYGSYPTAPPWAAATSEPAMAPAPAPAPEVSAPPYTQHGQLLVAHPELMQSADRPRPPSVLPTGVYTFLFGPLGAVSAVRRAETAARGRHPRSPYWSTFGLVMAFWVVVWLTMTAVLVPVYLSFREEAATKALESSIVHTPPSRDDKVTAQGATCQPTSKREANGLRTYRCTITFSNKKTVTADFQADSQGKGQLVH
jgi:hypothetical protein